jgi:hypothetical protein
LVQKLIKQNQGRLIQSALPNCHFPLALSPWADEIDQSAHGDEYEQAKSQHNIQTTIEIDKN